MSRHIQEFLAVVGKIGALSSRRREATKTKKEKVEIKTILRKLQK